MTVFGVNYGNRFIPEEWMCCGSLFDGVQSRGKEPHKTQTRLCLADLEGAFEERYLAWLDATIRQDDFRDMTDHGINVVRVPCGYWNWVTFSGEQTPNGREQERMRVLQSVVPERYIAFFDRVFENAAKYGLKVLLDLHALPGSQNGEMHSGISKSCPEFDTDWNLEKAVEAVSAMARYCARQGSLYGIQVINEPNNYLRDVHRFLDKYYERAILAAREYLPPHVPIVVFEWVSNFGKWPSGRFAAVKYGTVVWDTHIYSFMQHASVEKAQAAYWPELEALDAFHKRQLPGGCIVGEWSLAGPSLGESNRELASWLVWCFMERSRGCVFWNWDGSGIAEWNFKLAATQFGVDWKAIPKPSKT